MSDLVIAQKQDLINIADAIREKTETTDGMGIDEMAALIAAIEAGGGGNIATGSFVPSEATINMEITHNLGVVPNLYVAYSETVTSQADNVALIGLFCYTLDATLPTHLAAHAYYNKNSSTGVTINKIYSSSRLLVTDKATTYVDKQKVPCVYGATETTCTLTGYYNTNYHRYFIPGNEYKWIVGSV